MEELDRDVQAVTDEKNEILIEVPVFFCLPKKTFN
jgi:hypothetical protein